MRINAMTSTVGFVLLCTSTVAKAEWDEHWVTPWHLGWSMCMHSLLGCRPNPANKPRRRPGYLITARLSKPSPNPLPYPSVPEDSMSGKLPKIYSAGKRIKPFQTLPHQLPLQPLEGAPSDLAALAAALRIAESGGRLRMTFFGASHTGGDYWTGHIRQILQARYGDIGHGFTMPVSLYRGARGADINLCSGEGWLRDYIGKQDGHGDGMLGLGMSVSSSDPDAFGWLETTHSNPLGRSVSTYEILALGQPDGGRINVQLIPTARSLFQPTLMSMGSSIPSRGTKRLSPPEPFPFGDGEIRLFGVSAERSGPGVLVDSSGIRGREARTWCAGMVSFSPSHSVCSAPIYWCLLMAPMKPTQLTTRWSIIVEICERCSPKPAASCQPNPVYWLGRAIARWSRKNRYLVWQRTAMVAQVQREIAPDLVVCLGLAADNRWRRLHGRLVESRAIIGFKGSHSF